MPLLCLHGGPGFTHYYLEPLEALADRRQVIFYDQLGCGNSDRPDDISLWTVDRFVEELAEVRAALGLDELHLFGSSWGGMLAMQYTLDRKPDLRSLILCGSPASMIRWVTDCDELLAAEPDEVRQVIRQHEADGFTACPEYQAAILGFYRAHVCRLNPWPAGLERSFAEAGLPGLQHNERPERVHRHGHAEDLGHHGPARRDCGSRAARRRSLRRMHAGTPDRDGEPHCRRAARDHRGRFTSLLCRATRRSSAARSTPSSIATIKRQVAVKTAKILVMTAERIEVQRTIESSPAAIFAILRDPQGHVAIDSSGMLQSADGEPVSAVGDSFVVHMDRESLNDYPELGRYDVTVTIARIRA